MLKATKSRQLNLDELLRLKWLLGGVMSLIALWTVFFLDIEALSLVGIASAVVLAVLVWPQWPARIPGLVGKLAVPGIIVAGVVDFYLSPDTLPVLIRLAILLVLYRVVGYRQKREDLQLLVLGLFLIVVAGVLTVSLGFAFLLLAFTAVALGFLFVINLVDSVGTGSLRTPEAATAWSRLSWRSFFGRLRAVADWRLLTFAATLFTTVVVMSGLLFLVIPRFDMATGFFLDRYITRKSRSGFSDTVRFGDVTELAKDDGVAMRVDLTDARGVRDVPYWRLVVLDEYTPDGFRVSTRLKNQLLASQKVQAQWPGTASGRLAREVGGVWTFYIEPGVSRYLPLPGSYARLRLKDFVPLQVSLPNRIAALRTEAMTMTAFQLEGVEFDQGVPDAGFARQMVRARDPNFVPREDRSYDPRLMLGRPEGESNQAALGRMVAEITGGATLTPEEFGRRGSAWLAERHAYSLSVRIPAGAGEDSIVRWLRSNEPGFCEYFAAGLTVLARSAGIPARVVAGFHGGVLNAFENYFMVRNSDAHAWVELYDGQSAWLRFDPTPGNAGAARRAVAAGVEQEQDSSWSARWDSLRVIWYRRIVNFDSRQQVQMIDQVRTLTTDSGAALRLRMENLGKLLKAWLAGPWDLKRAGRALAGAAGIGALGWMAGLGARAAVRRWRRRGQPAGYDPVRQKAGQWLGRLRAQPHARDVVGELQRIRYGRRETWPEPRGVFRRARQARNAAPRR